MALKTLKDARLGHVLVIDTGAGRRAVTAAVLQEASVQAGIVGQTPARPA